MTLKMRFRKPALRYASPNPCLFLLFLVIILGSWQDARALMTINNPGRLRVFNNFTFNDDVVIKAGTFVDFRGTIKVATFKKITVEAGACLRIKNATVTHTSDNLSNTTNLFWGGIVIQGTNTAQDGDMNRLCASTFQGCMDKPDMTFIVAEYCLGNSFGSFVNGALYMDNANIRYADKGITLERAGLLHSINSKYENNLTYSIYIGMLPATLPQKSLIRNNKFSTDFRSSVSYIVGSYIYILENRNFYFPISNNEFNHSTASGSNTWVETQTGIQTSGSAVYIQANTFHNLLCAISCHAIALTAAGKKIENNAMYNCYVGIWNGSADLNIITKNTIYPATKNNTRAQKIYGATVATPSITGNSPVGILNTGSNSVSADRNNILKYKTSSNGEIGILNSCKSSSSSGTIYTFYHSYYKNRISKMYINVQSQAYPAPNQQLVSRAQFNCNTFEGINTSYFGSKIRTYRDMFITPSHSLQAQGTATLAAGNNFSALSYSGFSHIYNTGNSFNYYYNNTSAQNPALTTGLTKITAPANSCPDPIDYYDLYKSFCAPIYATPGTGIIVKKAGVVQKLGDYKSAILSLEANGITGDEKDEHDYLTNAYDVEMMQLLDIYYDEMAMETVNPERYYDSIANYLATHITFAGRYYEIALALDRGNYTLAGQYADNLDNLYPSEAGAVELGDYVHLLINYYSQSTEAAKATWIGNNFATIKEIADDDDNFASAKAREWVQYIADVTPENIYHGQIVYPTYILVDETDTETGGEPSNTVVNIYPNPFGEQLNVSVQNNDVLAKTFNVELYDLNYVLLQNQLLPVNPSLTGTANFNTSTLQTGYYVVRVSYGGNELFNSLVYKQ